MNVLIVKLSSLGDVVHAMPAVQDIRRALPHATVDWVVERGFAPLVRRCEGVDRVVPCEIRRWRKAPLSHDTRVAWRSFRDELHARAYDAVLDLQGLTKSALVARTARLSANGRRFALANRTEGSSYEAPTRWVADVAVRIEPRVHAVERSRELAARALGFESTGAPRYGLAAKSHPQVAPRTVCLVHGTSREDKLWPEAHWLALGRRLIDAGHALALPQGSDEEAERASRLAQALGSRASAWPRIDLGELTDRMAACAGVIGVDSGLSHIAVALDRPHVQLYNFDTAWRTGPVGLARQVALYASPQPSVDDAWAAWQRVAGAVA